eukprot:sb/3475873/
MFCLSKLVTLFVHCFVTSLYVYSPKILIVLLVQSDLYLAALYLAAPLFNGRIFFPQKIFDNSFAVVHFTSIYALQCRAYMARLHCVQNVMYYIYPHQTLLDQVKILLDTPKTPNGNTLIRLN